MMTYALRLAHPSSFCAGHAQSPQLSLEQGALMEPCPYTEVLHVPSKRA